MASHIPQADSSKAPGPLADSDEELSSDSAVDDDTMPRLEQQGLGPTGPFPVLAKRPIRVKAASRSSQPSVRGRHHRPPPPPVAWWNGEPVKRMNDVVRTMLHAIVGVTLFGIDADAVLVVHCATEYFNDVKERLDRSLEVQKSRRFLIGQDLSIVPAGIDQTWQHCVRTGDGYLESCGAVGLPVRVKRRGSGSWVRAVLGCCHCVIEKADAVKKSCRSWHVNGQQCFELKLGPTEAFVACYGDDTPRVLGQVACGVLGGNADASLTYLQSTDQVSADPLPVMSCTADMMTIEEVADACLRPVWKTGPMKQNRKGQVVYSQVSFSMSHGVFDDACVVMHQSQGMSFARRGDSGSPVFLRPTPGSDEGGKLLGVVEAVVSPDTSSHHSRGVWVRKTTESSKGASATSLLFNDQNSTANLVYTRSVTFVLPYCNQIPAISEAFNLDIEPHLAL